ncbi:MAG: DUF1127 domain-containing protein [Rhizobiales bacterium]|nr:DUF1127 domain-containing protein [Hyphomicrobiales bacterium]
MRLAIERARACRSGAIRSVFRRLLSWIRRRSAIARLRSLDDRMLKDIGIHRSKIESAVRGPERLPGAPVTALDQTRQRTSHAMVKSSQGHVGRAA